MLQKDKEQSFLNLDFFGMMASGICAIHCALSPLVIAISALGVISFLNSPVVEYFFLPVAIVLIIVSLGRSYFLHHKNKTVLLFAVLGVSLLIIGHLIPQPWIAALMSAGGGFSVVFAHYKNWKILRTCKVHDHH
jgi:hypothetical protein